MPKVYPNRYDSPRGRRRSSARSLSPAATTRTPTRRSRRYDHIPCKVDTGTGNHMSHEWINSPLDNRAHFSDREPLTPRRRGRYDDVAARVSSRRAKTPPASLRSVRGGPNQAGVSERSGVDVDADVDANLLGEVIVHPDDYALFEKRRLEALGDSDLDLGLDSDSDGCAVRTPGPGGRRTGTKATQGTKHKHVRLNGNVSAIAAAADDDGANSDSEGEGSTADGYTDATPSARLGAPAPVRVATLSPRRGTPGHAATPVYAVSAATPPTTPGIPAGACQPHAAYVRVQRHEEHPQRYHPDISSPISSPRLGRGAAWGAVRGGPSPVGAAPRLDAAPVMAALARSSAARCQSASPLALPSDDVMPARGVHPRPASPPVAASPRAAHGGGAEPRLGARIAPSRTPPAALRPRSSVAAPPVLPLLSPSHGRTYLPVGIISPPRPYAETALESLRRVVPMVGSPGRR